VGPGVVPVHGKFKNLDCQTALSATTGAKSFLPGCKIGNADKSIMNCLADNTGGAAARPPIVLQNSKMRGRQNLSRAR
jgi:hypothetical protein